MKSAPAQRASNITHTSDVNQLIQTKIKTNLVHIKNSPVVYLKHAFWNQCTQTQKNVRIKQNKNLISKTPVFSRASRLSS